MGPSELSKIFTQKRIEGDLRTSRTSLSTLREELADLQDSHSALARNTSQTIASQKSQITTLTHRTSLLEEELEQVKQIASERSRAVQELQDQYDDVHANQSSLIRKTEEEENMGVVREELHRQANYLRTLESTNSKLTAELAILRDRHASIEVLKEEKRGLERKIMVLEELREKVVKLEAEVEAGRQERLEWYVFQRFFIPYHNLHCRCQGFKDRRKQSSIRDPGFYYSKPIRPPLSACTTP